MLLLDSYVILVPHLIIFSVDFASFGFNAERSDKIGFWRFVPDSRTEAYQLVFFL